MNSTGGTACDVAPGKLIRPDLFGINKPGATDDTRRASINDVYDVPVESMVFHLSRFLPMEGVHFKVPSATFPAKQKWSSRFVIKGCLKRRGVPVKETRSRRAFLEEGRRLRCW